MKKFVFILFTGLAMVQTAFPRGGPFEPTVSQEESVLLNRVMTIAATNVNLAVTELQKSDFAKASPAMDFALGNLHFQNENLAAAATAYRNALKKLPRFRSAIMNLGRVYLLQEDTAAAIELYQQLVADGQADGGILLLLGHALLMENNPVSAESAYRQALLLKPKNPDAMLGLAKTLLQQERFTEGLALVGEILKEDPVNRELWSLRANAYLATGKYRAAIQAIEQALRLECADSEMLATLGDLFLNQNQPRDALRAYEKAFSMEKPALPRLLRAIDGFLMIEDAANAEAMIQRAAELGAAQPELFDTAAQTTLLRLRAELARQQDRPDEAMRLSKELLRIDPLDGRTMLMLAELQQAAGMLEEAVITCERAARIRGFEAEALVRHAQIEVSRERYARAVTLLEAAQAFRHQAHVARYLEQIRRLAE